MKFLKLTALLLMATSNAQAALVSYSNENNWINATSNILLVDFEGVIGSVDTQYSGVTFSGFNGGNPHTRVQFPFNGTNSMFTVSGNGGGGGWSSTFSSPVDGVSFWAGDVQFLGSTASLYDIANNLLGTFDIFSTGGGHGPFSYGFNGYISDTPNIARMDISIAGNDAVWFDNVQYSYGQTSSVPEPATLSLFTLGLASLLGMRRKRNRS